MCIALSEVSACMGTACACELKACACMLWMCHCDMQFHDGASVDNSTLSVLSGTGLGVVVTSTGPYLSVRLTTDDSIQSSGFIAMLSGEAAG